MHAAPASFPHFNYSAVPVCFVSLLALYDERSLQRCLRGFGGSTGSLRNLVSPSMHVEDWLAAIEAMQVSGHLCTGEWTSLCAGE